MGQFYKGAEATFIDDAMFKLPYEQMQTALEAKNTAIGKTIESAIKLGDFDIAHHVIDREDAAKLKQGWQNKIDETVNKVLENPLDYKSVQGDIIGVSRDLNRDINFGDIATIGKRKTQIEDYQKSLEELYKKDPREYAHQSALFSEQLKKAETARYKNAETGEYNYFSGEGLLAAPAVTKIADEAIKNATGKDFDSLRLTEDGQWKRTRGYKEEGWSDKEIKNMLLNYTNADPVLRAGLEQSRRLGYTDDAWLEQGLAYMKEKYKVRQTGLTVKDEAGDLTKAQWAYDFAKEKEDEAQPIINTENIVTNLTNTYDSFKNAIGKTTTTLTSQKQSLGEVWNQAHPNQKIDVKTATVGQIISKLSQLEKENPGVVNYSAEKEALKQESIKYSIAKSSEENYKAFLKENNKTDTAINFGLWAEKINNAKAANKAYNVETDVKATWNGIKAAKDEIPKTQSAAFANFPIMPFNLKGFSLPGVMINGKEAVVQFPVSKDDPLYRKLANTYNSKNLKVNDNGVNFIMEGGKRYAIDTRLMNKGGTATFSGDLKRFNYVDEVPTTVTTANQYTPGASTTVTSPTYFIAGTKQSINFEKETYAPKQGVGSHNQTMYQATVRAGNATMALDFDSKAKNVVTSPSAENWFDKNKNRLVANKTVKQYSGTANMDGKAVIDGKEVKFTKGVFEIPATSRGGSYKIGPDNELYDEYLSIYLDQKAEQN